MRCASERAPILVLVLVLAGACATPAVATRDTLPEVAPMPLSSDAVPLRELIEGRVAVVDLWASWCVACKESMTKLVRLEETYGPKGLIVAGVDVGESPEVARSFAAEVGVTYPIYADPDFVFADALNARELPALLVFDKSGRVVARSRALDRALLDVIKSLLEKN